MRYILKPRTQEDSKDKKQKKGISHMEKRLLEEHEIKKLRRNSGCKFGRQ